jgi:3-deoxy-manno-octulosonate cytidylyltransferase (CMP-KDO synthetase)
VSQDFCVIIPARFASSRLPGKPLLPIAGKPMIVHVWERALESGASQAFVATDDTRIADAVRAVGGRVVMTSPDHASGTDRLAEAVEQAGLSAETIIVNLQGDEPFVPGALLARLAQALHGNHAFGMATAATHIREVADVFNPNVVKVVLDAHDGALYFSRAPVPWVRDAFSLGRRPESLPDQVPFLRHIGLYAYRVETLRRVAAAAQAPFERAESLEQLRALWLGIRIHVTVVDQAPVHGVDTAEDLARVEREFAARSH